MPSLWQTFTTCAGPLALLLSGGLFFLISANHLSTDAVAQILVVISILSLLGWILVAFVTNDFDQKDEADKHEIGADSGGWRFLCRPLCALDEASLVSFIPLSLSLLWLIVFLFVIGSKALLQEEVFTETLRWQAAAFGGATALGILLIAMHRWWLFWRQPPYANLA